MTLNPSTSKAEQRQANLWPKNAMASAHNVINLSIGLHSISAWAASLEHLCLCWKVQARPDSWIRYKNSALTRQLTLVTWDLDPLWKSNCYLMWSWSWGKGRNLNSIYVLGVGGVWCAFTEGSGMEMEGPYPLFIIVYRWKGVIHKLND